MNFFSKRLFRKKATCVAQGNLVTKALSDRQQENSIYPEGYSTLILLMSQTYFKSISKVSVAEHENI